MSLENHNGDEISVVLDFVLTLIMFFEWAVMIVIVKEKGRFQQGL